MMLHESPGTIAGSGYPYPQVANLVGPESRTDWKMVHAVAHFLRWRERREGVREGGREGKDCGEPNIGRIGLLEA